MKESTESVSARDVINTDLRTQFEAVVNLEAEMKAFEKAVTLLTSGVLSVRGLKLTIESANIKGDLPTIKPSTAQYFANTARVRALKGAENKSLKETINVTISAKRGFKSDFETALENAKTYAEFKKSIPEVAEKKRKPRASVTITTADELIAYALEVWHELEDLEIEDLETASKFGEQLARAITHAKRQNRPGVQQVA